MAKLPKLKVTITKILNDGFKFDEEHEFRNEEDLTRYIEGVKRYATEYKIAQYTIHPRLLALV